MVKKKLKLKKRVLYKLLVSINLLIAIIILFLSSYYIYTNSRKINYYNKNTTDYSYLKIEEMSDSFATIGNKELHFVKDHNNIYIIAIETKEKAKYQEIIDYTYGKTKNKKNLQVYGYPINTNTKIKDLAIKYINKFLSLEERLEINKNNYHKYFGSTYLDTTINSYYKFNYIVFILFLLFLVVLSLFIKIIFCGGFKKKNE